MSKIAFYTADTENYFRDVSKILKKTGKYQRIIYVALGRPYDQVLKAIEKYKLNCSKCFFIDCVTKGAPNQQLKNVIFVGGQQDLTSLGIAISQAIGGIEGKKVVIFGSVGMLFLYNDFAIVQRFLNFITNKLRQNGVDAVLVATKDDPNQQALGVIKTFCDEVK